MKTPLLLALLFLAIACTTEKKYVPKEYSIEQFYKNTRLGGGSFSYDETKLLVSSDQTGIFNVYEIAIDDTSKRQLTHSDLESCFAIDYVPGTSNVLYSSDKGGNEINHLFYLRPMALQT